jgi:hypothetical protein
LSVFAADVSDSDLADPPDNMLANFTSTFTTVDTAPSVTSTNPANGATNVNPTATITISFSESVNFSTLANAANTSFDLECPTGTPTNFTVTTASPADSVVIDPDDNTIGGQTCLLTARAAGITDNDAVDPPDSMLADFTATIGFAAIANDDAYTVTPHLTLVSPVGVRANDTPAAATITGFGNSPGTANGSVPNGTNFITAGGAGGRVAMNADGTFVFYPDASDDNTDGVATFFYTIAGGDAAQVTLTFEAEQFVWFADQFPPGSAVCTGTNTGTQACPAPDFASLIAPSLTASDILFVNSGSYQCGITLPNNVQVIGNASSSTLTALAAAHGSPVTPVAGSNFAPYDALNGTAPALNSPAGDCFTLGQGNTVRGLTVGNTPNGHAFQDNGGTIGTATIAEVGFSGSGGIFNLANGGTLNATVNAMTATSSPSAPILLTNIAGTITQTGGGTISNAGNFDLFDINGGTVSGSISAALNSGGGNGSVVDVSGGHTGTLTFAGTVSSGAPYSGDNLQFDNADGAYNFNGETDLLAGSAGVNIQNGSGGTFTTTNINSSIANIAGISFRVNASAMTINTAIDITHTSQANRGVQIITGTGTTNFTGTLQLGTVGSPMLSAAGVFLDDTGAANAISFSDLNIITGTGGGAGSQGFVSQTSGRIAVTTGSIDCNGNLGADNHCFDVSNTTSSGVTFASLLSDHDDAGENGGGIFLNNAPGAFTFANVPRMTGNNAAIIQAANFGTLNVGTASTGNMETSNRPVWNLENGAVNVSASLLRSTNSTTEGIRLVNTSGTGIATTGTISIDLSPTSPAGILLQNITAGAYSFSPGTTVTITDRPNTNGIRIANSGGTIGFGNTTINSSGVGAPAIRIDASSSAITFAQTNINMNGAGGNENFEVSPGNHDAYTPRDNAGDGDAIYVTGLTGSLTISGGAITQPGDDGIDIRNSRNLSVSSMTFTEPGRSAGATCVDCNSSGIQAFALTGVNSVTSSSFVRGRMRNFYISNPSGTTTLNITGSTFDDTRGQGSPATDNLQIYASGTASAAFNISNSTFLKSRTNQINAVAKDSATITELDITGITMSDDGGPSSGIRVDAEGASQVALNVVGNPVLYSRDENVITVSATGTALLQGRVANNPDMRFTTSSAGGSAFVGIRAVSDGSTSRVNLAVTGNVLNVNNGTDGINLSVQGAAAARIDASITGNTLTAAGTAGIPLDGINAFVNPTAGGTKVVCMTAANNTVNGIWNRAARARAFSPTGTYVTGYSGSFAATWIAQGNNSGAIVASESASGGGVVGAPPVPCATPSHPTP